MGAFYVLFAAAPAGLPQVDGVSMQVLRSVIFDLDLVFLLRPSFLVKNRICSFVSKNCNDFGRARGVHGCMLLVGAAVWTILVSINRTC